MTETTLAQGNATFTRTKSALKKLARNIKHGVVVDHVRTEGQLTGRYLFMTVMSCAIAMLGLLLSSPAVIIGAMLISPLMGPIMLMGFSLSILELQSLRKAFFSMFCGVVASLATAYLIVRLSPITEATPEILARTRPNFFDLLVAIFSGLAGGYAVIHHKGETIVGVAIATALMPPLAVTGYGLAVGSAEVAGGSFFLFMTNLLAIALSVTILTKLYGFGYEHSPKHTIWQTTLILLVFGALSVPLGLALKDIAYETGSQKIIKSTLTEPFAQNTARVGDLSVSFPREAPIGVSATILTTKRVATAADQLSKLLAEKLGRPVELSLDQIIVNADQAVQAQEFLQLAESSLAAPLRAEILRVEGLALATRTDRELRNSVPFKTKGADINVEDKMATFFPIPDAALNISAYKSIESGIAANYPEWTIGVVPPIQELPLIVFDEGSENLNETANSEIKVIVWALKHWGVTTTEVVGFASTAGASEKFDNEALAYKRAQAVSVALAEHNIEAEPVDGYRAFLQVPEEQALGRRRFQTVLIRPRI